MINRMFFEVDQNKTPMKSLAVVDWRQEFISRWVFKEHAVIFLLGDRFASGVRDFLFGTVDSEEVRVQVHDFGFTDSVNASTRSHPVNACVDSVVVEHSFTGKILDRV